MRIMVLVIRVNGRLWELGEQLGMKCAAALDIGRTKIDILSRWID